MSDTPKQKLAHLKALAERNPFEIFDPRLAESLTTILAGGTQPYAGMPTLLDAPHRESLEGLDIALIGVPFDLGVTNRPGARFGPRSVRAMERTPTFHHESHVLPFTAAEIADVGDVMLEKRYALDDAIAEIQAYYHRVIDAGVIPLTVGGDHSITYPILEAVGREKSVGLVHFDAHCDTAGDFGGSRFHHGGPFLNAALAGVLDPERTIQIGIRGSAEMIWRFSYDSGMTVIHIEELRDKGVPYVIEKIHEVVGDGPTYISFDVDGLDPTYAPGTGTPEVGGMTPIETAQMIRSLHDLNLVGGDVVEIAPQYDPTDNTAMVGSSMLFEILCVLCQSLERQKQAT
jgi:agmatinase